VNVKPGLRGLELVSAAQWVDIPVTVNAVIGGRSVRRQFTAPLEGGIRTHPASAVHENALTFSRIDQLFGSVLATGLVRG
jgi:hypothetical protein